LDDLIYIILSNKTTPQLAQNVYASLKARFATWEDLLAVRIETVRRIVRPAGLSTVKTRQIRAALRRIRTDWGSCSLDSLANLDHQAAEKYLKSLPGVSSKVAKCVLMY